MYNNAARYLSLWRTFLDKIPYQKHGFSASRNDDVVNLLTETLQTDSSKSVKYQSDSVTWGALNSSGVSKGEKKGRKRKKKKNAMNCFVPLTNTAFSDFGALNSALQTSLNKQFKSLLPIQEKVLPHALENRSIIVQSETGSGKTLTYVIPIANALQNGQLNSTNRCIVIAPSKELASQIYSVFLSLVPMASSVLLLGADHSRSSSGQNKRLLNGTPVIVTTPASLNSKLKQGVLRLVDTSILVVDEFDRLFGGSDFEDQVSHVLAAVAKNKKSSSGQAQFLITSATVSEEMKGFVQKYIPNIKVMESEDVSPPTLLHRWIISPLHRRTETLLQLLNNNSDHRKNCKKCIIFVQRLEIGDALFEVIKNEGYFVTMINGDMSGAKRQVVFNEFKKGSYDILIATDLIARGIDIPDCEMVIQIQPGEDVDMYLHRAGRCARAGRSGTSYVIACDANINDRAFFNLVRRQINVDIVDATTFLPEKESGVVSVLENSLHHVSKKDELSFSIDIAMSENISFYQKLVMDLGLRPVSAEQIPGKKIFGMWFSSPVEAWAAQSVIKAHFKSNCLPEPEVGMFRHKSRSKSVVDWDGYFSEIRKTKREEEKLRYKNLVKQEMGKRRFKQGRYKFKQHLPGPGR